MQGYAGTAFQVSLDAMRDLGNFELAPIAVAGQFNPDNQWWHYLRPTAPDQPGHRVRFQLGPRAAAAEQ